MHHAAITGSGVFTPEHVITNDELVQAFNAYADRWNAANAEVIASGKHEAMGHSYASLWKIPTTMFRFFTVYGPWGRPDMALYKFVDAILEGAPIDIYNHGEMFRDFTYVDDLARAIALLIPAAPPLVEGRRAELRVRVQFAHAADALQAFRATACRPSRLGASSTSAIRKRCACWISWTRSRRHWA